MTVPMPVDGSMAVRLPAALPTRPEPSGASLAPCVWPEIRLAAPGVDGPNVVLYELSLIAKCYA